MSYILDALRRADSERERGGIPGLNAQSGYADPVDRSARPWWARPWAWVGAGLLGGLAVAAGAVWIFSGLSPTAPTAPAPALPYATPPLARGRVETTLAPVDVGPAPSMAPLESIVPTTTALSNTPAIRHAPPLTGLPTQPLAKAKPAPLEPRQPLATPLGQAAERIYTMAELPVDIQAKLPNLVIGGASYSEASASRLVILNGQVFHEGEKIATDLTLEKIQPKSAILNFKGYRYAVSY